MCWSRSFAFRSSRSCLSDSYRGQFMAFDLPKASTQFAFKWCKSRPAHYFPYRFKRNASYWERGFGLGMFVHFPCIQYPQFYCASWYLIIGLLSQSTAITRPFSSAISARQIFYCMLITKFQKAMPILDNPLLWISISSPSWRRINTESGWLNSPSSKLIVDYMVIFTRPCLPHRSLWFFSSWLYYYQP